MSFETSHTRWQAVTSRLRAADGHFVYAVKSTNIYCRPTCPARLARRANVDFYRLAQDAEAAGYRPCKRCKPQSPGLEEDGQGETVQRACDVLAKWAREGGGLSEDGEDGDGRADGKKRGLKELAVEAGKTPRYLHKIFKDRMGVTPKQYAKQMQELYHPTAVPSSAEAATATGTEHCTEGMISALGSNCNEFDFDLGWAIDFEIGQVGTQTMAQESISGLTNDASLSPDSTLNMPLTPSGTSDAGLWPDGTGASIANAQDLPALSSSALDGLLADAVLCQQKYNDPSVSQSAPDGLSEWVWEAEWSNAVVDSYQRSAAVL